MKGAIILVLVGAGIGGYFLYKRYKVAKLTTQPRRPMTFLPPRVIPLPEEKARLYG